MDKSLGAIEVETNKYTLPNNGVKHINYKCIDCGQRVILRKGDVRKPHFSHFSPTPSQRCKYYEHPTESQLHKDAKYKLHDKLKHKFPIVLNNNCPKCTTHPAGIYEVDIDYQDGDDVIMEYRDPSGKYVADVAVVNDNKVRYIFEVKHTHRTTTSRPDPWFEITADNIIEEDSRINDPEHPEYEDLGQKYYLDCVRTDTSRYCDNCRIYEEKWVKYLPKLRNKYGVERAWRQDSPCIECSRDQYNPVFIWGTGFLQICKICICEHEEKLKKQCEDTRKTYMRSMFEDTM